MLVLLSIYLKEVVLPYLLVGGVLGILATALYLWGQQLADRLLLYAFAICSIIVKWVLGQTGIASGSL